MSFLLVSVNQNQMRKLFIIQFLIALILVSCHSENALLKHQISLPKTTEYGAEKITIDSLNNPSKALPIWSIYYNDVQLQKLIEEAIANNFDLKLANQQVLLNQAEVVFMKGIRLPNLGVSLGTGARKFGAYTIDGVGNYDTQFSTNLNDKQQIPDPFIPKHNFGLYSTWEADIWGKLLLRKQGARQRLLATEQGVNALKTLLVSEVANQYYLLLVLDSELEMLKENVTLQENALNTVIAQKESGKSNELAFQMTSAQVLNTKSIVQSVEQQILEIEKQLNQLLGRFPQTVARGKLDLTKTEIAEQSFGFTGAQWIENRPDVRMAMHQLAATNADTKAAKLAFYPSLSLGLNVGFESFRASSFLSPASLALDAVGGLTAPILNRRELKAQLLSSKSNQKSAYLQFEKSVNTAFNELAAIQKQQVRLTELRNLKTQQVNVLNSAISTSKDLFATGRAEYLEIITAQENYLRAQIDLLDAIYAQLQNRIALYRALGGGW